MQAAEAFWFELQRGRIPVAFPIQDKFGNRGLAVNSVAFSGDTKELAESEDKNDRVAALIYAINFVHSQISPEIEIPNRFDQ